jgi:hypothetical protein
VPSQRRRPVVLDHPAPERGYRRAVLVTAVRAHALTLSPAARWSVHKISRYQLSFKESSRHRQQLRVLILAAIAPILGLHKAILTYLEDLPGGSIARSAAAENRSSPLRARTLRRCRPTKTGGAFGGETHRREGQKVEASAPCADRGPWPSIAA